GAAALRSGDHNLTTVPLQDANGGLVNIPENLVHHAARQQSDPELFFSQSRKRFTQHDMLPLLSDVGQKKLEFSQMPGEKLKKTKRPDKCLQTRRLKKTHEVESEA